MFHRTSITCNYIPLFPPVSQNVSQSPRNPDETRDHSSISHHVPIIPWLPDRLACHTISHRLLQNIYIHYCMTSTPLSILHLSHYYILPSHRLSYQTTFHRLSYYSHAAGRRESLWNPMTSTVYMYKDIYIYIYVCMYIYIFMYACIYIYICMCIYIYIHIYIHIYIYTHYITSHYICITLHYITFTYI